MREKNRRDEKKKRGDIHTRRESDEEKNRRLRDKGEKREKRNIR